MKILFICKKRHAAYGNTFGLYNSARMVAETLCRYGVEAKVVMVHDNNCIDRVVTEYNPTHVIIEALWVVPSKFHVLLNIPRHRNRQWVVRLHSRIPFLAMEGIAFHWLRHYKDLYDQYENFWVAANTQETCDDIDLSIGLPCIYQPNIYVMEDESIWHKFWEGLHHHHKHHRHHHHHIDIGCFGAIRPLKNQLMQAVAAIDFAESIGKKLFFHINAERTEQKGEEVLKNLRNLFQDSENLLVEHPWLPHEEFIELVQKMDIGMQVSYTETFNIVAADFVSQNVPIIVSDEMYWMSDLYKVNPNSREDIVDGLRRAYRWERWSLQTLNYKCLKHYNQHATEAWLSWLGIV